jgi:hypothetical protein
LPGTKLKKGQAKKRFSLFFVRIFNQNGKAE